MNDIQIFSNPEFGAIRTIMIDSEPWTVGIDVAAALGYAKPRNALVSHVDDEDKCTKILPCYNDDKNPSSVRGNPRLVLINESGLYSLILSSKLPSARRFKRWVTSEVLPALREKGRYCIDDDVTEIKPQPQVRIHPQEETHLQVQNNEQALEPLQSFYSELGFTPTDYLNAARSVAMCRRDQLPYVLDLLQKAGFDVAALPEQTESACGPLYTEEEKSEYAKSLWNALDAMRRKGFHYYEIDKILGKAKGTSQRYYARGARPRPEHVKVMLAKLDPYLTE